MTTTEQSANFYFRRGNQLYNFAVERINKDDYTKLSYSEREKLNTRFDISCVKAIKSYDKAIGLTPDFIEAFFNRAVVKNSIIDDDCKWDYKYEAVNDLKEAILQDVSLPLSSQYISKEIKQAYTKARIREQEADDYFPLYDIILSENGLMELGGRK